MRDPEEAAYSGDFSLVVGGPLYRLFLGTRLARPPLELLGRRIVLVTLLAWLPILVISALEGQAFGGVLVPFLKDLDAQVRLLVALPLLLLAEKVVHERLGPAVALFVQKGIVRPGNRSRFDAIVSSTHRWRDSFVPELCLLVFVLTAGHSMGMQRIAFPGGSWFKAPLESGPGLSNAGLWYVWISLPLFQFLLVRWWYRLVLWCRFLFLVSRLDLDLSPSHPDRAGGLGFLGTSTTAFVPLLMSQSALVSAMVGSRILREGIHLNDFKSVLGGALALVLFQALGPLAVFLPKLVEAKRRGLLEFGTLAGRYVKEFDRKWIRGEAAKDEPLVGSPDIQSLADLANSFAVVRSMRPVPFGQAALVQLTLVSVLPGLPLVLTVIPLDRLMEVLVNRMLGALL